jgi:hypothetical protein
MAAIRLKKLGARFMGAEIARVAQGLARESKRTQRLFTSQATRR